MSSTVRWGAPDSVRARVAVGGPDACEHSRAEAFDDPTGRGNRDITEVHALVAQDGRVGQCDAAAGEHHRQVADDAAWLVVRIAGVHAQSADESGRQTGRQRGACAGGHTSHIGCGFEYSHLRYTPVVRTNQNVSRGQLIGYVGGTPNWAPHLHFDIKRPYADGTLLGPGYTTQPPGNCGYFNPYTFVQTY